MQQESINEIVGRNVAKLRGQMSQAELARRLADELGKPRIDPTTVTRLERGNRPTTVNELAALARILGVPPEVLMRPSPFALEMAEMRSEVKEFRHAVSNLGIVANDFRECRASLVESLRQWEETQMDGLLPAEELQEIRHLLRLTAEDIIAKPQF